MIDNRWFPKNFANFVLNSHVIDVLGQACINSLLPTLLLCLSGSEVPITELAGSIFGDEIAGPCNASFKVLILLYYHLSLFYWHSHLLSINVLLNFHRLSNDHSINVLGIKGKTKKQAYTMNKHRISTISKENINPTQKYMNPQASSRKCSKK